MLRLYLFHATRCVPTIRKGFNCFNTFNKVKRYSVYLSEPISYEVTKDFFDKESGQWKERTVVQRDDTFEFNDFLIKELIRIMRNREMREHYYDCKEVMRAHHYDSKEVMKDHYYFKEVMKKKIYINR